MRFFWKRKRAYKKAGFSLVEIILSVAVLSVLSIFILEMFATARTLNDHANALDSSVLISETLFERIQASGGLEAALTAGAYTDYTLEKESNQTVATLYYDETWQATAVSEVSGFEVRVIEQIIPTQTEPVRYYRVEVQSPPDIIYEMEMRSYAP